MLFVIVLHNDQDLSFHAAVDSAQCYAELKTW